MTIGPFTTVSVAQWQALMDVLQHVDAYLQVVVDEQSKDEFVKTLQASVDKAKALTNY